MEKEDGVLYVCVACRRSVSCSFDGVIRRCADCLTRDECAMSETMRHFDIIYWSCPKGECLND